MRILVLGHRLSAVIAGLFVLTFSATGGEAAERVPARRDCGYQWVERTIQVPTTVTERRLVTVTECRTEACERTVIVQKMIPEIKQVRDAYVEMVPHVETRVERFQVRVPEWRTVIQDVTVQVPTQELRRRTRRVCRQVQVQEMCTVVRVIGHCVVTEQVPVLVLRDEIVEEPDEYHATVYHPEVRRQTVKVCHLVVQEKEREVQVTVCVPRKREAIRKVSTYRTVAEPQVQRYNVQVPYTVQKEVDVPVCRLVPTTVVCRIAAPSPSCVAAMGVWDE